MILDTIVDKKKIRVKAAKKNISIDEMQSLIKNSDKGHLRSFKEALKKDGISIIAEIKKASPSKGLICEDFHPAKIAKKYQESGAAAISVLTEEDFFQGSSEYLVQVKKTVQVPLLRKDFIFDMWQVYESALMGADAILLIAAILSDEELKMFREKANELNMDALVEAHNSDELKKALDSGADIIGINNRDLYTFDVSIKTTGNLIRQIPKGILVVSESGIEKRSDVVCLEETGVDAVLIGESLMRAKSIKRKMGELRGDTDG